MIGGKNFLLSTVDLVHSVVTRVHNILRTLSSNTVYYLSALASKVSLIQPCKSTCTLDPTVHTFCTYVYIHSVTVGSGGPERGSLKRLDTSPKRGVWGAAPPRSYRVFYSYNMNTKIIRSR